MTDKTGINGNTGKWFWPLYLAILPLLLVAIGALLMARLVSIESEIKDNRIERGDLKKDIEYAEWVRHELIRIQWRDPDTEPGDKKLLEELYSPKRGKVINKK